jgi:23S rRNA (adenine2030-N6)-methyltransferase
MLARSEARQLPQRLAALGAESWLDVRLVVCKPARDGFGMFGSGLYIVNPPWVLPDLLEGVMPWFARTLGEDDGAAFDLEHHIE